MSESAFYSAPLPYCADRDSSKRQWVRIQVPKKTFSFPQNYTKRLGTGIKGSAAALAARAGEGGVPYAVAKGKKQKCAQCMPKQDTSTNQRHTHT